MLRLWLPTYWISCFKWFAYIYIYIYRYIHIDTYTHTLKRDQLLLGLYQTSVLIANFLQKNMNIFSKHNHKILNFKCLQIYLVQLMYAFILVIDYLEPRALKIQQTSSSFPCDACNPGLYSILANYLLGKFFFVCS